MPRAYAAVYDAVYMMLYMMPTIITIWCSPKRRSPNTLADYNSMPTYKLLVESIYSPEVHVVSFNLKGEGSKQIG